MRSCEVAIIPKKHTRKIRPLLNFFSPSSFLLTSTTTGTDFTTYQTLILTFGAKHLVVWTIPFATRMTTHTIKGRRRWRIGWWRHSGHRWRIGWGGALPSNAKQGPDPLWNFPNLQLYGQMAAHDSGIRKKKRTMRKWDDQHEVNFSSSFVPAPSRRRVRKVWRSPSPAGFITSRGPPCIFWCPVSKNSPFFTAPNLYGMSNVPSNTTTWAPRIVINGLYNPCKWPGNMGNWSNFTLRTFLTVFSGAHLVDYQPWQHIRPCSLGCLQKYLPRDRCNTNLPKGHNDSAVWSREGRGNLRLWQLTDWDFLMASQPTPWT